ncbi:MAG: DUF2505 family protein [Deltaproteobacteria bacterium]|nr:DUF2505 family protein [Deltaproteobacteria bacterium]
MDWRIEHTINASLHEVEQTVLAPATTAVLARFMPGISAVEIIAREHNANTVKIRKRFTPSVEIPSFARGVSQDMTQWVEHVTWDLTTHAAKFVIEPNLPEKWKEVFASQGVYRLQPQGARTARIIEGTLNLQIPIGRAMAERYIVRTLQQWFDGEARALMGQLAQHAAA